MKIGALELNYLGHSGFVISNDAGKRIAIDPYGLAEHNEKVDVILITHGHNDHCSIEDMAKLSKPGTLIICPPDVQSKITRVKDVQMHTIEVGDEIGINTVKVKTVAAYNIEKDCHPKSEGWVGYIVQWGDVIVYHAGDSDKIPEMQSLSGYGKREKTFVALLPISGKTVMDAEEASEVASMLSPTLTVPMHYGAGVEGTVDDATRFVELCEGLNLKATMMEKGNMNNGTKE